MSEKGTNERGAEAGARSDGGIEPGSIPRPKLRRRPFGYKAADVDDVLDARDAELAELRQDVAALWLAFAQHDRMIRFALEGEAVSPPSPPQGTRADAQQGRAGLEPSPAPDPPPSAAPTSDPTAEVSIGRQLSDLDEVLAAIEMATQTLERTYADEIGKPSGVADEEAPADPPPRPPNEAKPG